jgi:hypothetical protein
MSTSGFAEDMDDMFDTIKSFVQDNATIGSRRAMEALMNDVGTQTTLNGVFETALRHKLLNMDSAITFSLLLRDISAQVKERNSKSSISFNIESAIDLVKAVYDLAYEDAVSAYLYSEDEEEEEEEEDEKDKKQKHHKSKTPK